MLLLIESRNTSEKKKERKGGKSGTFLDREKFLKFPPIREHFLFLYPKKKKKKGFSVEFKEVVPRYREIMRNLRIGQLWENRLFGKK